MNKQSPMIILIAGPYRSGTNDDPALMQQNLDRLNAIALKLFRAGHIPLVGEWLALPLLKAAGSAAPGDEIYREISYPVAHRLITKCDAVLRISGESKGADQDIEVARSLGIKVYDDLEEILRN
ncbi:MAG TPA: DUF4406 domain-containing protein [Mucilaginibacter sp.]|nr:DUF4406 domain-containing protein [Mucilaginibacter sp.]